MELNKNYSEVHKCCEMQVSWKKYKRPIATIKSSKDSVLMFRELWSPNMEILEEFNILILNRANNVVGWYLLSKGGTSGTVVDIKIVINLCIQSLGCAIILCHNHPSGNLKPSSQDIEITKKIKEACKLFDILLLDHVIITDESSYSFADEGLL